MDWFPKSRDGQIHFTDTWISVFQTKAAEWNIPAEHITALITLNAAAKAKLAIVTSGERTKRSVVECKKAFKELAEEARFIKNHYLLIPPLQLTDLPTLLLKQPDTTHSTVGVPTGQPSLSVTYPGGPHLLKVRCKGAIGVEGSHTVGRFGIAVYKGIMPYGGATLEQAASAKHYLMKKPLSGSELLHWKFTHKRSATADFDADEAGMTVFFCARYENNKGQFGAWGNVVSAIIP